MHFALSGWQPDELMQLSTQDGKSKVAWAKGVNRRAVPARASPMCLVTTIVSAPKREATVPGDRDVETAMV
jgi:hypothetical protein